MMYKVKETDTHIYFLTGPFSQWHMGKFKGTLRQDLSLAIHEFNCAEQYMMASKAYMFGDLDTLEAIMKAETPREQKQLGRQVKNFDSLLWSQHAQDYVFMGNLFRAIQQEEYMITLLRSKDKILVEGSQSDAIWGVGLDWSNPAILDEANWLGTNWLGKAHMRVREIINIR